MKKFQIDSKKTKSMENNRESREKKGNTSRSSLSLPKTFNYSKKKKNARNSPYLFFNDIQTGDVIIKVLSINRIFVAHFSILCQYPYFLEKIMSTQTHVVDKFIIIDVYPPIPSIFAFCMELLYYNDFDDLRVTTSAKFNESMDDIIKQNFTEIFLNATYLRIMGLVSLCQNR